jgi:ABC-2 type transport system permease protein
MSRVDMSRKIASGRRPVRAIFLREWRIMNRTPIFLLNGILTVILVPVIFVMAKVGSKGSDVSSLFSLISSRNALVTILVSAAFMTISGSLNGTAPSAFSREGSQFWMSKVIPVSAREQLAAKFLHSYIIGLLGIAAASLVLIWQFRLKAATLVPALILALAATFVLTVIGLAIDLARPLLDWTNPQKAIKQNLNVLVAFLSDLGFLAIFGFIAVKLKNLGLSQGATLTILGLLLVIIALAAWLFLVRFARKRYAFIEV